MAVLLQPCTDTHRAAKNVSSLIHISQLKPSKVMPSLPSCSSSHTVSECPFRNLFSHTFHLSIFVGDVKMAPNLVLKCFMVSLWARRLGGTLRRRSVSGKINFIQAWVVVLLAMSSISINQPLLIHMATLNRNTYKTKLSWSIDENAVTRGSQEPNPVYPLGAMLSIH